MTAGRQTLEVLVGLPGSGKSGRAYWRTFSAVWLYAFAIIVVAIAVWSVT